MMPKRFLKSQSYIYLSETSARTKDDDLGLDLNLELPC